MIAAIHQLHYFPWMGYLDKMAKSDAFVILDTVQLTDASNMFRHQLLDRAGEKKFITIPFNKKGYMQRPYNELEINSAVDWQTRQKNFIWENYKKHSYFTEIWEQIEPVFVEKFDTLCQVTTKSVDIMRDIFQITTPLVLQSNLTIPDVRKSEFLIDILHEIGSDTYLSGNGAKKYMDMDMFEQAGIHVVYQQFHLPEYSQKNSTEEFVPGISGLDILFNCGIEESRRIFWNNVKLGHERDN